jgi:hypothetical protein
MAMGNMMAMWLKDSDELHYKTKSNELIWRTQMGREGVLSIGICSFGIIGIRIDELEGEQNENYFTTCTHTRVLFNSFVRSTRYDKL